jgi:hypothetical protein
MPKRKCQFLDKYTEEFPFIKKGKYETEAFCKHCSSSFSISHGGLSDIKDHINTQKHKASVASSSMCKPLTNFFVKRNNAEDDKLIATELCFAYHVIKHHQSFSSTDCINKLLPKLFNDSKIAAKYSSARTKTTKMITNVLAPHSVDLILDDLSSCSFYSISTDASNHKAEKIFPLVIQYFTRNGIQVKLLKLGNLHGETSSIISNFCTQTLKDEKLDLKKCVAFCGDNANVNFGGLRRLGKNNVFAKLKEDLGTDIEGIGCPAHILNNALQTSADQLSCDIDQIVFKIFSYFSIYTVRTERLKEFCEFVNVEYRTLLSYSKTRWLSLLPAVERILKLFDALKSFFLSEEKAPKTLLDFFNNSLSEAYLWFIHSEASAVHYQILKIEGRYKSVIDVLDVLNATLSTAEGKKDTNFIPASVKTILRKNEESGLTCKKDIKKFHDETSQFHETFVSYLSKWITPLKKYSVFSWMNLKDIPKWEEVEKAFNYMSSKNIILNETFLFSQINVISKIVDEEKKKIPNDWNLKSTDEKWIFVFAKIETEFVEQYFDIYKICEYMFCIPPHNANVERIFSLMEIQWTDERNRLLVPTVEGILKCFINFDYNCCDMFEYLIKNKALLKKAKSERKYE